MKPTSRRLRSKKIRGIQYEIESCFIEDKNVFQKIGDMIKKDFSSVAFDAVTKNNSWNTNIDKSEL